jgi:hypothetical protein
VDLFPAMLNWLGIEVPEGIDAEPVWLPGSQGRLHKVTQEASFPSTDRVRSSVG